MNYMNHEMRCGVWRVVVVVCGGPTTNTHVANAVSYMIDIHTVYHPPCFLDYSRESARK